MTWLRTNFIGSILPFGLGLLYARYEEDIQMSKTAYGIIALVSIALIFVTSLLLPAMDHDSDLRLCSRHLMYPTPSAECE